jgi:hypothetical protein
MSYRFHATVTISKRRIFETFISPALYAAITIGLLLGYFLVSGFVHAVDSSGLNYFLNPVYELIARSLAGTFGDTYVIKLFAEGPFLFAFNVAFLPFLLYLAVSSVYRFGFEKNVGALELLMYGPADGTSCFLAFMIRNMVFTLLYSAILLLFFWITALLSNMVLGPKFFYGFIMILFLALAVYAYGILTAVLSRNGSVGTALFAGIVVFLLLIQMGSYTIVTGYVRNLSTVLASIIKWISPLHYWTQALSYMEYGFIGGFLLSILFLILLTAVLLLVSHFIIRSRGVRE